ncbi:MAG TPA: hypothetical protein VGH51_09715, partial [Candidatus Angelobacter sp.]
SAARPLPFQSLAFSAIPSDSRSPSFEGDIFSLQLRGDIILEHLQRPFIACLFDAGVLHSPVCL